MLFNSLSFAVFLPVVFILYWYVAKGNLRLQNILLLISSYFFYACWDWRFVFLLFFSTWLDYASGLKIFETGSSRGKKTWLWISILINLGFLGVFKYYNFFISSFAELIAVFGFRVNINTLKVILPVGISFYTFHGLSYVIDLYKNRIKPEKDFVNYALFVSFFPLLVAGPIERATHLLPQISRPRQFEYAKGVDGLKQILWGLFKKVVIADNCAVFADEIFNNAESYSGSTLLVGALFFAFQIYGDFSGYSDIALGTARLFGISLLRNFAFPYFSRDIAEFWRRWHISLSSWFKDYVYIPLGGSRGGTWMKIRNTFIIFLLSGLWHGANWTFVAWGFLNALFIMPSIIFNTNRSNIEIVASGKVLPTMREGLSIAATFGLTVFAWIFFRATDITSALHFVSGIFSPSFFTIPRFNGMIDAIPVVFIVIIFMVIEWIGREYQYALAVFGERWKPLIRWGLYYMLMFVIFYYAGREQQFIYFQF